jgi:hypothetical protein
LQLANVNEGDVLYTKIIAKVEKEGVLNRLNTTKKFSSIDEHFPTILKKSYQTKP